MKTLIVGAGAGGGYIGAALIAAGRDVTFLVREATQARLREHQLQVRDAAGVTRSTTVRTVAHHTLQAPFDIVIVAVRAAAVPAAIEDMAAAVGPGTAIVPIVNGVAHLDALVARFGSQRVLGAAAKLMVSKRENGVIVEIRPGVDLEVGALDEANAGTAIAVTHELGVEGLNITISDRILDVMWSKFAFITSTAALTSLLRSPIGPIARAPGGPGVARAILSEVTRVAAAAGHPLGTSTRSQLFDTLTDPTSQFAPSMYRDLTSGHQVEAEILGELIAYARQHAIDTPLLNAAAVAAAVHNNQLATAGSTKPLATHVRSASTGAEVEPASR